jgi:hypothetical protein
MRSWPGAPPLPLQPAVLRLAAAALPGAVLGHGAWRVGEVCGRPAPRSPPSLARRSKAAAAALRQRVAVLEQAEQLRRVRQQTVGKQDAAAGGPDLGRCAGACLPAACRPASSGPALCGPAARVPGVALADVCVSRCKRWAQVHAAGGRLGGRGGSCRQRPAAARGGSGRRLARCVPRASSRPQRALAACVRMLIRCLPAGDSSAGAAAGGEATGSGDSFKPGTWQPGR